MVSVENISLGFPYISLCKTCEPPDGPFLATGPLFEQTW